MIALLDKKNIPYDLLLMADPSKELVDKYLSEGVSYVYKVEGEVAGVYILKEIDNKDIELINIAVKEEYQGRGIAKKLISHAKDIAREKEYTSMLVGTGNSSLNQLALYQKCGFRLDSIKEDFFVENYDEEIWENGIRCIDMVLLRTSLI